MMRYAHLLIIIFVLGCSNKTEPVVTYSYFPSEEFVINGVAIGNTYEQIINKLGAPKKEDINTNEFAEGKPRTLFYSGLEIFISSNQAVNIKITDPEVEFLGVAIGDSKEKALQAFGKGKEYSKGTESRLIYAVKHSDGRLTDAKFIIHMKNEIIEKIEFWYDFT